MVARLRTCTEPIRLAASTTPGQAATSALWSLSAVHGVAAPMAKPPPSARMPIIPAMRLISTMALGAMRLERSWTIRSVPPASTRAPESAASRAIACSTLPGEWNCGEGMEFLSISDMAAGFQA